MQRVLINMKIKSVMTLLVTLDSTHSAERKDNVLQTQGEHLRRKRSYK